MTVAELREKLASMPQDAQVQILDEGADDSFDIEDVLDETEQDDGFVALQIGDVW